VRAATATFVPPEALHKSFGYTLVASPTLYPGQVVRARLGTAAANTAPVTASILLRHYGADDALVTMTGPASSLEPGASAELTWRVPDLGGAPSAQIGVAISAADSIDGTLYLDDLTWDGAPDVTLDQPAFAGGAWRRAWVDGVDTFDQSWHEPFRLVQNRGDGLVLHGTAEWRDYRVTARVRPHLAEATGLVVNARGLRRWFGLRLVRDGRVDLVEVYDDDERVLTSASFAWDWEGEYDLSLETSQGRLRGWVGDQQLFEQAVAEADRLRGAVGLFVREGSTSFGPVRIAPVS
jgi:hypothetical protein